MSWLRSLFAPAPPASGRPALPPSAAGYGLFDAVFPEATAVAAAGRALLAAGADPVVDRLVDSLRPGAWPVARAALQALREGGREGAPAAPVALALAIAAWPVTSADGYDTYGLHEAVGLVERLQSHLDALAQAGSAEARLLADFLRGPGLDALLATAGPPLVPAHRALVGLLAALPPGDPRAAATLVALADLPLPAENAGWHTHTRAETLRALAARAQRSRAAAGAARPFPVPVPGPVLAPVAPSEPSAAPAPAPASVPGAAPSPAAPAPSPAVSAPSLAAPAPAPASGAAPAPGAAPASGAAPAPASGAAPAPASGAAPAPASGAAPAPGADDPAARARAALLRELHSGVPERVRLAVDLLPTLPEGGPTLDAALPALLAWCADADDPATAAVRARALTRLAALARPSAPAPRDPAGVDTPFDDGDDAEAEAEAEAAHTAAEADLAHAAALARDARATLQACAAPPGPDDPPAPPGRRAAALRALAALLPADADRALALGRAALDSPHADEREAGVALLVAVASGD